MNSLVPVFVCIIVGITFGVLLLTVAHLLSFRATAPSFSKKQPYECGLLGEDAITSRVPVPFYLTAILFVLFDIEIIFLYPWACAFNDFINEGKGLTVLWAMVIFLLIFVYGLLWEILSKALIWK